MYSSKHFFDPLVRSVAVLSLALVIMAVAARGQILPPPIDLSSTVVGGQGPVMAIDTNGNIYVAWSQASPGGVFFRRSIDGGVSFGHTVVVQASPASALQMALDASGDINLLWASSSVFFSHSADGGASFSTPIKVPSFGSSAVDPNGNINIAWLDSHSQRLLSIHSTEGGAHFSAPLAVWGFAGEPADVMASAGPEGQFYLFWYYSFHIDGQCDVLFSRSIDGGGTFSTAANISHSAPGACSADPSPFVDASGNINVAWSTRLTGPTGPDIWSVSFARSTDAGATFSAPKSIVSGTVPVSVASGRGIAVDPSGAIGIVWNAGGSVLFAHSADRGDTFSTPVTLSLPLKPNFSGGGGADTTVDSAGNIIVAWEDDGMGTFAGDDNIFFRRSKDGGVTFSAPVNRSNNNNREDVSPHIATDLRGNSYIVWQSTDIATHSPSVFFGRVPASSGAPLSNVQAKNITATSATITWTTTQPADSQVAYFIGSAKPTWSACCNPTNVTSHAVTLAGLTPKTTYNFFVESTPTGSSTQADSSTSTFSTLVATKGVTTGSIATAKR